MLASQNELGNIPFSLVFCKSLWKIGINFFWIFGRIGQILRLSNSKNSSISSVLYLVAQLCPTLCNPMDYSPPGSSVHGDSPGKNTGVGCHALLQGIFPAQGSKSGSSHCRQILYHLSHQGSPRILERTAYPFSRDLPDPGIELGFAALQADSLPIELPEKPESAIYIYIHTHIYTPPLFFLVSFPLCASWYNATRKPQHHFPGISAKNV